MADTNNGIDLFFGHLVMFFTELVLKSGWLTILHQ